VGAKKEMRPPQIGRGAPKRRCASDDTRSRPRRKRWSWRRTGASVLQRECLRRGGVYSPKGWRSE